MCMQNDAPDNFTTQTVPSGATVQVPIVFLYPKHRRLRAYDETHILVHRLKTNHVFVLVKRFLGGTRMKSLNKCTKLLERKTIASGASMCTRNDIHLHKFGHTCIR